MSRTAAELDALIWKQLKENVSVGSIAKMFGVGERRVRNVRDGVQMDHQMGPRPRITKEIRSFIETNFLGDAQISDERMAGMVNARFPPEEGQKEVTRQTICTIRNQLNIRYRPAFTIQNLSAEHIQARLDFATVMLEMISRGVFNCIFSDESRFCRGPDNNWVRVRKGEWNETACVAKDKFPMGVMVYGAIGPGFKGRLCRMSGGVGKDEYIRVIMNSGMVEQANSLYPREADGWWFMQDGAPAHTAADTVEHLSREMRIVPMWPPNSPDLNPIEMVWGIIGKRLAQQTFGTVDELYAGVEKIWNELDQGMIDRLVADFKRRLELVVRVGGRSISQLLSSGIRVPRQQDIGTGEAQIFTEHDDQAIVAWVGANGHKWVKLAGAFPQFIPGTAKRRYLFLYQEMLNQRWEATREFYDREVAEVFPATPEQEGEEAEEEDAAVQDDADDDVEPEPEFLQSPQAGWLAFCASNRRLAEFQDLTPPDQLRRFAEIWATLTQEEKASWGAIQRPPVKAKEPKKKRGRPKKKG